jgi:RNA 3'-terminal phosphate cyclase
MALANGKSKVKCREITLHTKTAIYIAEQFTDVS